MGEEEVVAQTDDAGQGGKVVSTDTAGAAKGGMNIRLKILLVLLVLSVLGAAGLKVHGAIMARTLAPLAEERLKEFTKTAAAGEEYASDISADREFGLYGELLGKVAIFIKTKRPEGEQYAEVDYVYTRGQSGGWEFKESGGCSDDQCRVNAIKAFARTAK